MICDSDVGVHGCGGVYRCVETLTNYGGGSWEESGGGSAQTAMNGAHGGGGRFCTGYYGYHGDHGGGRPFCAGYHGCRGDHGGSAGAPETVTSPGDGPCGAP